MYKAKEGTPEPVHPQAFELEPVKDGKSMTANVPQQAEDSQLRAFMASRSRWHGWYLGSIVEIQRTDHEDVLLAFEDPAVERAYQGWLDKSRRWNDFVGLVMSTAVALLFMSKAKFESAPAKIFRKCAWISMGMNVSWMLVIAFAPGFALKHRNPAVYIIEWYLHCVVACLPPLTYHSYETPASAIGSYVVSPISPNPSSTPLPCPNRAYSSIQYVISCLLEETYPGPCLSLGCTLLCNLFCRLSPLGWYLLQLSPNPFQS